MLAMFKQAGSIPSNVIFNKGWTDHWNEVQNDYTRTERVSTGNSLLDQAINSNEHENC